ncbi:MAG TPA: stage V sporulation protein AD [Clostridiales bacterium]|nr:stage V sporulation protein AD [Clostridiales bacterium]
MGRIQTFKKRPTLKMAATMVGGDESKGPLGHLFDLSGKDTRFGMPTWEQAESEMVRMACETFMAKGKIRPDEVDLVFAGDLINQCTVSTFGFAESKIPYFGLYSACSTAAEGLILGGVAIEAEHACKVITAASSHFCTAERQYRFPIEYGSQRTPTAQHTVTGAGCFLLDNSPGQIYLNQYLVGSIVDYGATDVNNMGGSMAPAVVDTLVRFFMESTLTPDDFDLIITGDLGSEGHSISREMLETHGIVMKNNYLDCGILIYDIEKQDMHAGGSGCGCSAVVMGSYVFDQLQQGKMKDVLFIGTGSLQSPITVMQKQSIPGIAHLLRITRSE